MQVELALQSRQTALAEEIRRVSRVKMRSAVQSGQILLSEDIRRVDAVEVPFNQLGVRFSEGEKIVIIIMAEGTATTPAQAGMFGASTVINVYVSGNRCVSSRDSNAASGAQADVGGRTSVQFRVRHLAVVVPARS